MRPFNTRFFLWLVTISIMLNVIIPGVIIKIIDREEYLKGLTDPNLWYNIFVSVMVAIFIGLVFEALKSTKNG